LPLDPRQRRQRTLDAVKRLPLRESRSQPLLLVIEDLAGVGLTMTGETFNNLPSHPRVALLGAGTMGAGMAQRMLDLGFQSACGIEHLARRLPWPRTVRPSAHKRPTPWLPQRSS